MVRLEIYGNITMFKIIRSIYSIFDKNVERTRFASRLFDHLIFAHNLPIHFRIYIKRNQPISHLPNIKYLYDHLYLIFFSFLRFWFCMRNEFIRSFSRVFNSFVLVCFFFVSLYFSTWIGWCSYVNHLVNSKIYTMIHHSWIAMMIRWISCEFHWFLKKWNGIAGTPCDSCILFICQYLFFFIDEARYISFDLTRQRIAQ